MKTFLFSKDGEYQCVEASIKGPDPERAVVQFETRLYPNFDAKFEPFPPETKRMSMEFDRRQLFEFITDLIKIHGAMK